MYSLLKTRFSIAMLVYQRVIRSGDYYFDPPAFFRTIILTPLDCIDRTIAGEPLVVENSIKTIIAQAGFYGMGYTQSGPLLGGSSHLVGG